MPQDMGRDLFLCQRGAGSCGRFDMPFEHVGESPPRHRFASGVDEHFRGRRRSTDRQPGPQRCSGHFPKRHRPFSTAFAVDTNAHRRHGDVIELQAGQLRYAQTGAHRHVQHGPIADPLPRCRIGGIEQRLGFVLRSDKARGAGRSF